MDEIEAIAAIYLFKRASTSFMFVHQQTGDDYFDWKCYESEQKSDPNAEKPKLIGATLYKRGGTKWNNLGAIGNHSTGLKHVTVEKLKEFVESNEVVEQIHTNKLLIKGTGGVNVSVTFDGTTSQLGGGHLDRWFWSLGKVE